MTNLFKCLPHPLDFLLSTCKKLSNLMMKEYLAQSHAQIGLNGEITLKFSATSHKSLPSFPMPARPFELPECRNLHFSLFLARCQKREGDTKQYLKHPQ